MTTHVKQQLSLGANTQPFDRFFDKCIGSCHAYLTLREDFRAHVREVQDRIGFNSIRCHGIFHDWVGVYSEVDGQPVYNFHNVDKIYDFFLEQDLKPYVELSFMPQALASGDATIFHYQANITPPKDYNAWAAMITEFLLHLIERYGLDEVLTWNFEVWNEPDLKDLFWSGSQQEYFELYRYSVNAIKAIDPRLKVGGPSTSKNLWIQELLDFCEREQLPIDFISTHHYCADASLEIGSDVFELEYRGQPAMRNDVVAAVEKVRTSVFPNLEVHYSEWNVSPCHQDKYGKDSEFTGTFVLQTLRDLSGVVDSYSFWCLSDIFEELGPSQTPFSGKYGLISMDGLRKTTFHAYHFLSALYGNVLNPDDTSSWVTKDNEENIRVLSWNHDEPTSVDFNGADYQLEHSTKQETIYVTGVHGQYSIVAWVVDKDRGNSYRNWQKMGEPQYLSKAQVEQLKSIQEPHEFINTTIQCNGELTLTHQIGSCGFVFYEIKRINEVG